MEKTKVETLYENDKSRGFVNHLIAAYMPISKTQKIFTFEKQALAHKCSVCNHDLLDLDTIFQRTMDSEYISQSLKEMSSRILNPEVQVEVKDSAMFRLVTHGAVLAWTGENTNTELCADCVKDLLNLVTNGLLRNDKNITYQVKRMQRNQVFNHFRESSALEPEEKEKVTQIQKSIETNKKHTVTLGDFGVLQQLKEKMEKESTNTK